MDKIKTVLRYKNFITEMSYTPDCCMVASIIMQCFRRSVGPPDISGKNRVGQIKFRTTPDQNVR